MRFALFKSRIPSAAFFSVSLLIFVLAMPCLYSVPQDAVHLPKPLQHEVTVVVKLVQVYVTDKSGKPVTHLDKSAFRIFDNGILQAITEFERHMSPAAGVAEPSAKEALLPTETVTPRLGRKFFVLIDLDANDLEGIAKSRAAAIHFMDTQTLPPDEIGVFSSSFIRGIVLHCYLTTDHVKVREAIQRIREVPGRKSGGAGDASTWTIAVAGQGTDNVTVRPVSRGGGGPSLDKMIALAKALRYIPGYKNILYFSQGGSINDRAYRDRLDEMSREFAASNAPLYAINSETPDPFNPGGTKGEALLAFVADKSGGKAYKEIGSISHFPDIAREIQELTRNYYVLGFPMKETWDGKFHKIKVELTSGDYHLQSQPGYYNPKPFRDYSDLEKDLHLFDLAMTEKTEPPLPLMFAMRALAFEQKGEARVLLLSKIPADVIEKFLIKKVEVVSLIFDDQDNAVERRQIKPDLSKFRGMDLFYSSDAALRPGTYRCRIIVRDLDTGDAALAYARAVVPAKLGADGSGGALTLLSPLLLAAGSNFAYLDGQTKKNSAPWMDFYVYDRAKYSPIAGETVIGTKAIYALLPFSLAAAAPAEISISASLIDTASGANLPIPSMVLNKTRKGNIELQLAELTIDGIAAGKYILYVRAEEAGTKAVAYAQVTLIFKRP
jgi:VWFA-related protein